MITALLLSVVLGAPESCAIVDGSRIEMRHLRSFLQTGVEIPNESVFGAAPQPGVRRTVSAGELVRWAKAHGAENPVARDACFEWATRQVTENEATEAMQASLELGTELKILELSRFNVPAGKVYFPRASLREPSLILQGQPIIWFGYVQYSQNQRAKIWAKVILSVSSSKVTTLSDVKAGETIKSEQISQDKIKGFPYLRQRDLTTADFVGKTARRSLRSGTVLTDSDVVVDPDVKKGDVVEVEARIGQGVLRTQAVAEASGRIGERILLRNAESGKVMRATLVSGNKAVVIPGLMPVGTKGPNR
ncbi:flagellar basal body P-ring formation chaperone FlgA [Paludibaculum fermentans]|uniref:Flagellar basal body P-ring formation protein FlgA n=1 Tax=Paludibaculum fermentans TaxID=1473598 RepID=A0A7S7NS69_PALFE|nr:flagellar basal body P-ring formation chaperone FlgA [Paludibaculum fermentans]QOY88848.1 flagellar basal body P-ring formation protein FlgA [Paludibaculum fermentans]